MPKGVDTMMNRFTQLRRKEVINLCDGCRLGCVGDVEVKLPEGEVRALIVFGPCRFFGLFGRGEDYYIPWECIQKFGDDIILIDKPFQRRDGPPDRKHRRWGYTGTKGRKYSKTTCNLHFNMVLYFSIPHRLGLSVGAVLVGRGEEKPGG